MNESIRLCDSAVVAVFDGEAIVFDTATRRRFRTNEMGSVLVSTLLNSPEGMQLGSLMALIDRESSVSDGDIEAGIGAFFAHLDEYGLLAQTFTQTDVYRKHEVASPCSAPVIKEERAPSCATVHASVHASRASAGRSHGQSQATMASITVNR